MIKKCPTYYNTPGTIPFKWIIAVVAFSCCLFSLFACTSKADYKAELMQLDSLRQSVKSAVDQLNTIDTNQVKAELAELNSNLIVLDSLVGDTIYDKELAKLLVTYSTPQKTLQLFMDTLGYMQFQLLRIHKQLNNLTNDFNKRIISDTLAVKALTNEKANVNALVVASGILTKMVTEQMNKLIINKTRINQYIEALSFFKKKKKRS